MSVVVFASTLRKVVIHTKRGNDIWTHKWHAWETGIESMIGVAVCTETISTLWIVGRKAFLRDCWCILDAVVMALTVLSWFLSILRRALARPVHAKDVWDLDLCLFALRFVLQPCRVVAAVSMVRRISRMQSSTVDIVWDTLPDSQSGDILVDQSLIMTTGFQEEITLQLPVWCRYREWKLVYSPDVHGLSMQVFYRTQEEAGDAYIILVRDGSDHMFGAFSTDAWRLNMNGCPISTECFIFTDMHRPNQESHNGAITFHRVVSNCGTVLMSTDSRGFSFSNALYIRDDFSKGATMTCKAFGSPPLTEGTTNYVDFAVQNFECWRLV